MNKSELALFGGAPVKVTPFGKGRRFGEEEKKEVLEALEQDTLFYHFGQKVKTFLSLFNELYGLKYSVAASSGTAALHVALGAAGITVGDEVITSPITDQGTVIGILYQNAIPVFADLDPHTYNMTAESIRSKITSRTKAILVVHLAGTPCDMDPIMELAKEFDLKVIEDCAQSYLTRYKGRLTGTIGHYGCFSTNDYKHISTGDGGIVTINSGNEEEYRRVHAFADKNYERLGESVQKDITSLAPNYRMTELQGAVGIGQLKKLPWICEQRHQYGTNLTNMLMDMMDIGIIPHKVHEESYATYWFYMFRIIPEELGCTVQEFEEALRAEGIPCQAGYIPKPLYLHALFQQKQAYPNSHFPFELSTVSYKEGDCPVAEEILKTSIRIPVSEFFTDQDNKDTIQAIQKIAAYFSQKKTQSKKGETV
jgi:perosamine synthetase